MPEFTDTHPKAQAVLIEGYRRMTPAARLRLALEMSQAVIELAEAGIRQRYPEIGPEELRKRLGALMVGRELSIKVNGWDPEKMGY